MPLPIGFTPEGEPKPSAKPPVPAHVKDDHYVWPKDRIKRALKWAALALLVLAVGIGGYTVGHWRPGPGPEPEPRPSPVEGTLWVTLVYDGDAPGMDFARIEADPALEEGINKLGGHLRKFTKDSHVLGEKNLSRFVDEHGTPTLIIQAEGVKRIKAEPCPKSAAEIVAEAKAFREGRK